MAKLKLRIGKPSGTLYYYWGQWQWQGLPVPTLLAWQGKDLCFLGLSASLQEGLSDIQRRWPAVDMQPAELPRDITDKLCLWGSDFDHRVWLGLANIHCGQRRSYSQLAQAIGKAGAHRAVASAVGRNPLSLLIPCHRIVRSDGKLGGYHWGSELKQQLLAREARRQSEGSNSVADQQP